MRSNAPLIGGESNLDAQRLLAARPRRRHLHVRRARSSTARPAAMHLNKPINGMERTPDNSGYWLVADDGGIFSFGNAKFYGSTGGQHLNKPVLGMERTHVGKGYWLFACDGGIFTLRRREVPRLARRHAPRRRRSWRCSARATGNGYWMMTADGHVLSRSATPGCYGDIGGVQELRRRGAPARCARTARATGSRPATARSFAFGDAKSLGFPATVGGHTVGLIGARRLRSRRRSRSRAATVATMPALHPRGARGNRAERVACGAGRR